MHTGAAQSETQSLPHFPRTAVLTIKPWQHVFYPETGIANISKKELENCSVIRNTLQVVKKKH